MDEIIDHYPITRDAAVDRVFEDVVGAIGKPDIADVVVGAIRQLVDAERIHAFRLMEAGSDQEPYCSWSATGEVGQLNREYLARYQRADPVATVIPAATGRNAVAILKISRGDLSDPHYRRRFFDRYDIRQRISIVRRYGQASIVMSVARRGRLFTPCESRALEEFGRFVLPVLERSRTLTAGEPDMLSLEARFAARRPDMPLRERQVCARTMIGMTAEAAALDLGIATSTVLTYRRRAYTRLGICSAYQLATQVMH
ncbi:MAG TPA: LuxR C-terminal-related transcriptional regulator [Ensifer sp.]|nr:LuxR C-terminal-related transcriptional regulator [Ensifer sp.]